jgi:hypothetical protein
MTVPARKPGESTEQWLLRVKGPPKRSTLDVCTTVHDSSRLTKGHGTLAHQFRHSPKHLKQLIANAKREGVKLDMHDIYNPTLCREGYPLDPQAVMPQDDATGHCLRRAKATGRSLEGDVVSYDAPPVIEKATPLVDPKIVNREVNAQIQQNPGLATKRTKLEEDFINKHGPQT